MFPGVVEWCSVCNSRPADGKLTVLLEGLEFPEVIPACEPCVHDPKMVEFVSPENKE